MFERHGHGYPFWRRLFTLHDYPALTARVFSVGGNFQHRFDDPRMIDDIKGMGERFAAFYPRDPFSTRNLSRLMPFEALTSVNQGMDVAFLLRRPERMPAKGDHFCWFFGRSNLADVEPLVEAVSKATGLRPHKLSRWLKLPASEADQVFKRQRNLIGGARFVLTDTYHLLINSIVMGTPIIPIARMSAAQDGTLGDFKKFTLMEMLGLSDRLIQIPEDAESADTRIVIAEARQTVEGGEDAAQDYNLARSLADKFRADLKRELFGITTGDTARDDEPRLRQPEATIDI